MRQSTGDLHREAALISRYLLGRPAGERERALYVEAIGKLGVPLGPCDARLWRLMMRVPSFMRSIDTALAFTDPQHPVRRRIFIMLAILEASPGFADEFLPKDFPRLHLFRVLGALLSAVVLLPAGYLLLLANRARCR